MGPSCPLLEVKRKRPQDVVMAAHDPYPTAHLSRYHTHLWLKGVAGMRRRTSITRLGGPAASVVAPLQLDAQVPGRTYRLGVLIPSARQTPPVVAFFDELRLNGFVEGQNLKVILGGFDIRNEQVAEQVAAILKAAPDAIVSGGLFGNRAVHSANRTFPHVAISEDMVGDVRKRTIGRVDSAVAEEAPADDCIR